MCDYDNSDDGDGDYAGDNGDDLMGMMSDDDDKVVMVATMIV